jgi:hypothetical protein
MRVHAPPSNATGTAEALGTVTETGRDRRPWRMTVCGRLTSNSRRRIDPIGQLGQEAVRCRAVMVEVRQCHVVAFDLFVYRQGCLHHEVSGGRGEPATDVPVRSDPGVHGDRHGTLPCHRAPDPSSASAAPTPSAAGPLRRRGCRPAAPPSRVTPFRVQRRTRPTPQTFASTAQAPLPSPPRTTVPWQRFTGQPEISSPTCSFQRAATRPLTGRGTTPQQKRASWRTSSSAPRSSAHSCAFRTAHDRRRPRAPGETQECP